MIGKMLRWVRRNTRKAVAVAVAPGLVLLAVDAAISHFAGKNSDNRLQLVPVIYSAIALLLIGIAVVPKSMALFAWTARITGFLGVATGVAGAVFHLLALRHELNGDYSWSSWEGALSVAPPVFAPLGFAGIGALLMILPSSRLLLRLRVGPPASGSGEPAPVVNLKDSQGEKAAS